MQRLVATLLLSLAALVAPQGVFAMEYFVSPDGSDTASGRRDQPFRTLARAAQAVGPGDVCTLRAGVYRETLRPAQSGSAEQPITWRVADGEQAVISGADPVTDWRREADGLWSAPLAWDLGHQNQVLAGAALLNEARWPTTTGDPLHPTWATVESGSATTLTDPNLPGADDAWQGALLWCASGDEWICQSVTVTSYSAATHTLTFTPAIEGHFYQPRRGNHYVLIGVKSALTGAGEWWFDDAAQRLWLRPPAGADPHTLPIEAKRRLTCVDLSGRQHLRLQGLALRAGGLQTDAASSSLVLDGLRGEYLGHSYRQDVTGPGSVALRGTRLSLLNSRLAWSSGSLLQVGGSDNVVANCHLEGGNYAGKWSGAVSLGGRRTLFAYNTVRHSGRDLMSVGGLIAGRILYNDLSDCGWLTNDLGLTYGHSTDFGNTEIAWNLVHDNHARSYAPGIYFDHCSHNVVVHHNLIWNVKSDPIRFNNPSSYMLAYNNSCWHTGAISTFDHSHRDDLPGCRYQNNIVNQPIKLPLHVVVQPNLVEANPAFTDPEHGRFELRPEDPAARGGVALAGITADTATYLGACVPGAAPWLAGADLGRPLAPLPPYPPVLAVGRNLLLNPCFERETLEGWTRTGGEATLTKGNGWGNTVVGNGTNEPTGTSARELCLTGRGAVEQAVTGVRPGRPHQLAGWLKVAGPGESVELGVRLADGTERTAATIATTWTRVVVEFTPAVADVVVFVRQTATAGGKCWADNLGLPPAD